jgi:predicted nucleic acid-binding protein
MSGYALDTNIVSYFLRDNEVVMTEINNLIKAGQTISIPPFVYYEIKRWLMSSNDTTKIKAFEYICKVSLIDKIEMNTLETAASIYVELKKLGKIVDDSDLFIAACCIQNDYALVTNNVKHFENVDGLTIVNWMVAHG